jgi:lysophospholipase L1-like esterase
MTSMRLTTAFLVFLLAWTGCAGGTAAKPASPAKPSSPVASQPVDPERFAKDVAALEARDATNRPPAGVSLFYGSSSFVRWSTLKRDFPERRVLNHGFGGSHASDALYYFDRLVRPYRPAEIYFYEGDNDLAAGKSPDRVMKDTQEFVRRVRAVHGYVPIHLLAVKYSPLRLSLLAQQQNLNRQLASYARWHRGVDFIDVATPLLDAQGQPRPELFESDRLHLNARGYEIWTRVIHEAVPVPRE